MRSRGGQHAFKFPKAHVDPDMPSHRGFQRAAKLFHVPMRYSQPGAVATFDLADAAAMRCPEASHRRIHFKAIESTLGQKSPGACAPASGHHSTDVMAWTACMIPHVRKRGT